MEPVVFPEDDGFVVDDATGLHVENMVADTKKGDINIKLAKGTGKYRVDIIPLS